MTIVLGMDMLCSFTKRRLKLPAIVSFIVLLISCFHAATEATEEKSKGVRPSNKAVKSGETGAKQRARRARPSSVGPRTPSPLEVEGFRPASHVGPAGAGGTPDRRSPWPVVVALHGNYDRPEWECDLWNRVAGFHGWILCPRGVRTPHTSPAEDRWTYLGAERVKKEIVAGLEALERRYPGQVKRQGSVLAGFSLGAIYAPRIAKQLSPSFSIIFLVEGGLKKAWSQAEIRSLKRKGILGVGMAMSDPGRRSLAKKMLARLKRGGIAAAFVDMKGAGHNYSKDFSLTGRQALVQLLLALGPTGVRAQGLRSQDSVKKELEL